MNTLLIRSNWSCFYHRETNSEVVGLLILRAIMMKVITHCWLDTNKYVRNLLAIFEWNIDDSRWRNHWKILDEHDVFIDRPFNYETMNTTCSLLGRLVGDYIWTRRAYYNYKYNTEIDCVFCNCIQIEIYAKIVQFHSVHDVCETNNFHFTNLYIKWEYI